MAENITLYERMATFEEQQKSMSRDIAEIKESVKSTNTYIQTISAQNDLKYAPIRTTVFVDNAIWVVLVLVITAVVTLVLKNKRT